MAHNGLTYKYSRSATFLRECGHKHREGPFHVALKQAYYDMPSTHGVVSKSMLWMLLPYNVGRMMEDVQAMLKAMNEEVRESQKDLEDMHDKLNAVYERVAPQLEKQITDIRQSRMAMVSELRQALTMMTDVRKFFLDADYEREMDRLERFIRVCRDIQTLKKEGVFDAICDSAIRLALREPER